MSATVSGIGDPRSHFPRPPHLTFEEACEFL